MINILRIGHRIDRDKRITTHVALVARAFGADRIFIDRQDKKLEETIRTTVKHFGGNFQIETGINPKKIIKKWDGVIIHLTMYGERLDSSINQINKDENILIIIGAEKVPVEIYDYADYNISIGNQPHSEVAALAIFLDRFSNGEWKNNCFNGEIEIIPCKKGKQVKSRENEEKYE